MEAWHWVSIALAVLTALFGVIGYLLNRKDQSQSAAIKLLFEKHDKDAQDLQDLRVKLAENHYSKHELDDRINRMETAFRDGMKTLNEKLDQVIKMMMEKK